MQRILTFGKRLPTVQAPPAPSTPQPDWMQASPRRIEKMLARALARPSGGWMVVDNSRQIGARPKLYCVDGQELVLWRHEGQVRAAPGACPHMQASLDGARVRDGQIICPWHGLALGPEGHGRWRHLEAYDDGVLCWVRVGRTEAPTTQPIIPLRPAHYISGVVRIEAQCEPCDVIANRLDPWHGVHFHPHSFARLQVFEPSEVDLLRVRVAYRVAGPFCIEVDCTFHCPEPRTIVMTIVEGEGKGSVVETHATPLGPGKTMITEATLASSERLGFRIAMLGSALIRPWIEKSARRLWVEDATYAERTYQLRQQAQATRNQN